MTIHFAAARPGAWSAFAAAFAPVGLLEPANDNGTEPLDATLLRAALAHFARHGLGAAENARGEAERAFFAGNRAGYQRWLSVCRALDRRMASRVESLTEPDEAARER